MFNLFLYLLTVGIWGTTWLAIKFQLGEVSPEVSVFYRFTLAATLMLIYCGVKRLNLRFSLREHLFLGLLGISMFSIHVILIYKASVYLVSGLVSVIFSLVNIFNIVNSYLFFRSRVDKKVVVGAFLGFMGIILFFWKDLINLSLENEILLGAGLALAGALVFSLGNMLSKQNQKNKMDLIPSTAVAMSYGAVIMFVYTLVVGHPYILPTGVAYWSSLAYLVVLGSIVGFLCYLYLISKIGPERAGYITVLFPVVALMISFIAENYQLDASGLVGFGCILAGNCLVMIKKKLRLVPVEL